MPIIVQLYILTALGYIVLSRSIKEVLADNFLKKLFFLLVYACTMRILLGLNPQLPFFFHGTMFLAYAVFVPGIYLCIRNYVNNSRLTEPDLVHVIPFLTLCIFGLLAFTFRFNVYPAVRDILSFSTGTSSDSEVVMPLFLFIYCLTASIFSRFFCY